MSLTQKLLRAVRRIRAHASSPPAPNRARTFREISFEFAASTGLRNELEQWLDPSASQRLRVLATTGELSDLSALGALKEDRESEFLLVPNTLTVQGTRMQLFLTALGGLGFRVELLSVCGQVVYLCTGRKEGFENTELPLDHLSFSQEGEDKILMRLLEGQSHGFYVDVGAHHPVRFSNTYLFYMRGWRGLNIDASPGSMVPFLSLRPRDTNLELGVDAKEGQFVFYEFAEPALSTFSKERAMALEAETTYRVRREVSVQVRTLASILEEHLPPQQEIDFLSIDVESKDLDVLQSNDWSRFRPRFVLAEDLKRTVLSDTDSQVRAFLIQKGYALVASTPNTRVYQREARIID